MLCGLLLMFVLSSFLMYAGHAQEGACTIRNVCLHGALVIACARARCVCLCVRACVRAGGNAEEVACQEGSVPGEEGECVLVWQ